MRHQPENATRYLGGGRNNLSKKLTPTDIEERILHTLALYPQISPSMMQIALNITAKDWRPVLEALIACGKVSRKTIVSPTPSGRHQSYIILHNPAVDGEVLLDGAH